MAPMATDTLWQDIDTLGQDELLLPQVATQNSDHRRRIRKLFPLIIVRRSSRSVIILCGTFVLFLWGVFVILGPVVHPHVSSSTIFDIHEEPLQLPPFQPPPELPDPPTEPEPSIIDAINETAEQAILWKSRAESVREAFRSAYNAYETFASPRDELLPLTNGSKNNFNGWGVTVVDSLDTMFLMGLHDEFQRGIKFVDNMTFFGNNHTYVPFFETTIRYLGGLLSAYALSGEYILLKRADELGNAMLPVFNTSSGLPTFSVNPVTGKSGVGWSGATNGLLAEIATCQLEYKYLAHVTGRRVYYDVAENINNQLYTANVSHLDGLFPTAWNLKTGEPSTQRVSIGSTADSAYEYLLKQWLLTNQTEEKTLEMYLKTADKVIENLLYLSPIRDLLYVTDVQFWKQLIIPPKIVEHTEDLDSEIDDDIPLHELEPPPKPSFILSRTPSRKFEHLSCFLPGLFALGTHRIPEELLPKETREMHLLAAQGLGHACWMMYADQPSGLGPDEVTFLNAYDMRNLDIQREKEIEVARLKAEAEESAAAKAKAEAEVESEGIKDFEVVTAHLEKRVPVSQSRVVNQTTFDESHRWLPAYDAWIASGRVGTPPGLTSAKISPPNSKTRDYRANNFGYFLRPETVESFYILWRTTGDIVWRERGWKVFEALLESAQAPNGAFASVNNVQRSPTALKNEMPSFFLAETLKYLYLLFNDDDLVPLDRFVFNTEAHPLPIFRWTTWQQEKFGLNN